MENSLETQFLAEFTLGAKSWRTVFVALKDTAPAGIPCSHPLCNVLTADPTKARVEQHGYRISFVKLTKIHSLDTGEEPELHAPEVKEVKKHLHAVLNNVARPIYLCGDCFPHRLHDILNKPLPGGTASAASVPHD